MSTTIDQRVVEMRFDNKQFESNVSTTMSTLDKLKQSLNFTGASKGLENIGTAAKNVNMSGLSNSVETVRAKFSALEVMGVTALANITNSAVNAGKRIVSALTIDPVTTGFNEYELKMNSVQTIMSSTGESIDTVNSYLNELNEYSDKTIYSFSDMTQNIGKFTNAGVKLEDAVMAIKGISNEAAVSGANANEASRAMYNFAQALSAGYVKLIDWKSIENANMATVEFKNQLIQTAVELGTVKETADGMYETLDGNTFNATKNFNEVLQDQWMTTEVLVGTLKDYADETTDIGKKAFAAAQDVKTFTQLFDTLKESAQSGWAQTWELLVGDLEEAKEFLTRLSKLFGGFIDSWSEARNNLLAGALDSKWSQLESKINAAGVSTEKFQAKLKETASEHGIALDDLIKEYGSLERAFASGKISTDMVVQTLKKFVGIEAEAEKTTEDLSGKLAHYKKVVDEVWLGKWGNGEDRVESLTAAHYNAAVVQKLVNKTMGERSVTTEDLIEVMSDMTEAELKNIGYTKEEVEALQELAKQAEETGTPINELIENLGKPSGRELLLESLMNIIHAIVNPIKALGQAWKEVFPPMTSSQLYNIIEALHNFTSKLVLSEDNLGKLTRTFKGVFAVLDIVLTLVGGPLKVAFKVITKILGMFNLNILDVTSVIGDALVKFRDWIDSCLDFDNVFKSIMPTITKWVESAKTWVKTHVDLSEIFNKIKSAISGTIGSIRDWIKSLKDSENLPRDIAEGIVNGFGKVIGAVKNVFMKIPEIINKALSGSYEGVNIFAGIIKGLWNGVKIAGQVIVEIGKILLEKINGILVKHGFKEIPADMFSGFINGIKSGATKVFQAMIEFANSIIEKVKDILGIHSPSTVFFAIGGFIIAGLIAGLLAGSPDIMSTLQTIGGKISEFFGDIDFGTILSAGLSTGLLVVLGKFASSISTIANSFDGIADILDGVGDTMQNVSKVVKKFSGVLGAIGTNIRAKALKEIAIAIAILAASVIALSFIEPASLWKAVGAIAALAAVLAILMLIINKGGKGDPKDLTKQAVNVAKLGFVLLSIGASILLIAFAMKVISGLDWKQGLQALIGLAAIVGAISLVLIAYGKIVKGKSAQNIDKAGKVISKMAISMLLMAFVIKIMGSMDTKTIVQGGIAVVAFAGVMVGLVALTKLAGKKIDKAGSTIFKMAAAMLLMAFVVKIMGSMDTKTLIQGGIAVVAFGGIMVGLVALTKLAGTNLDKLGSALLGMGGAMLLMAIVVKMLGGMDTGTLVKGTIAVAALGGIIVGLVASTKLASDKELKRLGTTLLAMSISIGILAAVVLLLSLLDASALNKGIIAVGVLSTMMALMIFTTKDANDVKGNLIVMTIAIVAMAAAVVALSMIDGKKLAGATIALGVLMGIFALLIKVSGNAKGSLGTLIVMTVAVGLLGGLLYLLATLPVKSTMGSAASLSLLMLTMTGVLFALSKIKMTAKDAFSSALALTLMAVPLIAFVGVLSAMQNVKNAMSNVLALSALATVMTLLLIPLTIIGKFGTSGAPYLGALALLAMAVPLIAFVGVLAVMQNVQNAKNNALVLCTLATVMTLLLIPLTIIGAFGMMGLPYLGVLALLAMAVPMLAFVGILYAMEGLQNAQANADLLIGLMTTMTQLLVVLAIIGPFALIGVTAMAALELLMISMGALAIAVGALMEKFPQLESFLDKGIPILEKLAYAIGSIAGNLIGGFVDAVAKSLPGLGTALSDFMTNATPFIEGIKMVDKTVLENIGILAGCILALTAVDLINGVISFIQGGSSFADLGTELSRFMQNAMPFIMGASLLNADMMTGVKALAETVLILTGANILEGLTSWLTGGSSLATFGEQLAPLGTHLSSFAKNLGAFGEEQITTVQCAADAIKILAEAADTLPNEGGWLGAIVGDNNIGTFGAQLPTLATNLSGFSKNLGTFTDEQVSTITCAADAIKVLAEAAENIPNEGGWLAAIVGDNSIETFGGYLPGLGTNLAGFAENLGTFDDAKVATVTCAANAIKAISEVAANLPNEGGWLANLVGDNSIETFGGYLPGLGTDLAGFAENLGTFKEEQVTTVQMAIGAIRAFAALADVDLKTANSQISGFGSKLPTLGSNISDFASKMPESSKIDSAKTNLNKVVDMVKKIAGVDASSVKSFSDSLKKMGKDAVTKFIEAFTNTEITTAAENAGKTLVDKVAGGMALKLIHLKSVAQSLIDSVKETLSSEDNYTKFFNIGAYLVSGFCDGIDENTYKAEAQAAAMAAAAAIAAEEELDENSPSKVGYAIGDFFGLGFVNGIGDYSDKAYNTSADMAGRAKKGLTEAVSKIKDFIDSDMDTQPTIRPILDLSDVESGASALDNMLGFNSRVGVLANAGTINSMMNQRIQNVGNDDVVSAIDRLRDKLDGVGSSNYNINGVTYDDGSNIAETVKALVRAVRIEGRV